jgi:hypothetical protein
MILSRRKLIGGLGLLVAAPAVLRGGWHMPIKPIGVDWVRIPGPPDVWITGVQLNGEELPRSDWNVDIADGVVAFRVTVPSGNTLGSSVGRQRMWVTATTSS